MELSHSASALRMDSRGTTAASRYCISQPEHQAAAMTIDDTRSRERGGIMGREGSTFSSVARGSTVRASAWTAPQSRMALRMRRRGDRTSAVKTNSGTAVATCTSCPAAIRCRTTYELRSAEPHHTNAGKISGAETWHWKRTSYRRKRL